MRSLRARRPGSRPPLRSVFRFLPRVAVVVLAALTAPLPAAPAAQRARAVVGNTVISRHDPAVEIRLARSVHYVGTARFVLSDRNLGQFDNCELFAFVDSDSSRRIRKFDWIQFEAYLPTHPQLHHVYNSPRHATIAGLDFYVDTGVSASDETPAAGSDDAQFSALLASHGYRRTDEIYVRLVHLTDATKRRELMIIYAESLAGSGYTAAQLEEGGKDHAKWAAIADALIRRGERSVTIRPEDPSR